MPDNERASTPPSRPARGTGDRPASPSRRSEADSILKRALDLSGAARREFLDRECRDDAGLRAAVEGLLGYAESDEPLLPSGGGAGVWLSLAAGDDSPLSPDPGERVGDWRIVRTLGRGGMATVFLAERADGHFEQTAALKVLDAPHDRDGRFLQERQILATLDHPNIARLIDGGSTKSGQPFVVMEYIEGVPIDRYCDEHRLTLRDRILLFDKVAGAVQYAHEHFIVHRDIKPSNILVTPEGEPRLLDFGIAKLLDEHAPGLAAETRDAFHPMTPAYASPEQLRAERLTTASDVYQLGFLLYRLLTGCDPYRCDRSNVAEVVRVVCEVEPTWPSAASPAAPDAAAGGGSGGSASSRSAERSTTPERLRRQLTGDLDNILMTSLRKDPALRYSSVTHLRDDLRRYLHGMPVTARPPTLRYRATKFAARHRTAVAGVALVALAVTSGVLATIWQARATAREAQRAQAALEYLVGLFESADPNLAQGTSIPAKALLDRGVSRLETELADAPLMRAEVLGVIGGMYTDLGLYTDALPVLEEVRKLLLAHDGSDAAAIAGNADRLAAALTESGRYEEALKLAEEAVALRRTNERSTPDELSTSIGHLAAIRSMQGFPDEAAGLYRQALDVDRGSGNEALLASHLSDLSASRYRAQDYEAAREIGRQALDLHRKLYGPDHTLIATSLFNLGSAYAEQGDYATAEELLRECLAMRRRLLGDEHPHVALVLSNLGQLFQSAGRLDEAEAAHREALAIRRATLGEAHPDTVNSLNHIGVVLYFNAEYREAADTFRRVVPLWKAAYGARHVNVFSALNNLGAALREAGDYDGAEDVLRETLALRREEFGPTHQQVAQSLNNLALVLARKGEIDEAERLIQEAVAMWRETMGDGHPDVADGLHSLGRLLLDDGRCDEAEAPLRESLEIRERALDAGAPLIASVRLYLAECLLALGRADEAGPYAEQSLPVLVQQWGDEAEITQRAHRVLADLQR